MALPPEHISIKRRRQEEPVDVLYLENDRHQNKRRFTDYCFQRVKVDTEVPAPSKLPPAELPRVNHRAASSHVGSGIPVVRATSPGAEIRDEAERRAAQKALRHRFSPVNVPEPITPAMHDAHKASLDEPAVQHETPLKPLRRFHLSHGPRTSHSIYLTGIQKRKTSRKRHVATFVERSDSSRQGSELLGEIASQKSGLGGDEGMKNSLQCGGHGESSSSASKRTEKTGQSMYDHPSTWDLDSDNLANELAAFALEISQNEKGENARNNISDVNRVDIQDTTMSLDQDFIYDTYVRVPIGGRKGSDDKSMNDVGLIVIDDEDQEFWQTFVESDEDSGWDEEDQDSNAEDNPANDYPDEEIDSEDEYGYGVYKHRNAASDDEEYDLNDPWSDSEQ